MGVDEPGHEQGLAEVYFFPGRPGVLRTNVRNAAVVDGDDTVNDGGRRYGKNEPRAVADHGRRVSSHAGVG